MERRQNNNKVFPWILLPFVSKPRRCHVCPEQLRAVCIDVGRATPCVTGPDASGMVVAESRSTRCWMDQFLAMQTDALTTIAVNVVTKTQGAIARNVTSELESVRSRRLGLQWRPKKKQLREAWGANQRNRRMPWRGRRRLLAKRRGSRPARGANRLAA